MSVLCLGEILVDCVGDLRLPGGAPANVACHVAALGENAALVSRVGDDADGKNLTDWLAERRIAASLLQTDHARPTGSVRVRPGPSYEIAAPAAWDFIELASLARSAGRDAQIVVFGTLAQRNPTSRKTVRGLVEAARSSGVPALCDLNLRAPFYTEETVLWSLRNCDVLKLNREELEIVSLLLRANGETADLFTGLLREFSISRAVLTDGQKGAWFCEVGEIWHQPCVEPDRFVDAVGAGDAFAAVLSVALARGISLRRAAQAAAALSSYVVSRAGGTPVVPRALVERINAVLGD